MLTIAIRLGGVILTLVGVAVTTVGVWFAVQLGPDGTAEFTTRPRAADPVLIGPDVLNRVDADVVVTATPAPGATAWMALANPSDAAAVLGDARRVEVSGVEVRDWALTTQARGTTDAPQLGAADLWRQQDQAQGPVTLTVAQDGSPKTLVVAAQDARIETVRMTVSDKTWFVESVVAALVGLFLVVAGVLLVWPRRPAPTTAPADTTASSDRSTPPAVMPPPTTTPPTTEVTT
ncbi:MAG: hypothetical protein ACRCY8_07340 [Dermatophilaceae bacterium]